MTWPQKSWGHTAWVMLLTHAPRSNESRSSDVAISGCLLEIECRSLGKSISLSLRSNIGQNEVKSGRFSTNWWGLVSLVPERKSKFRVLNHLTATPVCRFHYFLVVHDAKCITLCQNCIFSCSFFREMCVARDKLLCICFWESLFSVARLQTFLIGPWPWALILVIMT